MSIPYLIDYLDVLDSLPNELSRQYTILKEVETSIYSSKTHLKELVNNFLQNLDSSPLEKTQMLTKISTEIKKIKKIGYEQVAISASCSQMVNEHVARLESDLLKFEEDQLSGIKITPKKRKFDSPRVSKESAIVKGSIESLEKSEIYDKNLNSSLNRRGRPTRATSFKKQIKEEDIGPVSSNVASELVSPALNSEPTYCICSQVSFGEMIACDNEDCSIEWFHYKCVGLDGPVKGKWYCPECQNKNIS